MPHELVVDRVIDSSPEIVWRAMTEHLAEWWAPKPWTSEVLAFDLAPGGRFEIAMRGPEGEGGPISGLILAIEENKRLVFTNVVDATCDPQTPQPVSIVGSFELRSGGAGRTLYRASARHWSAEAMEQHRAMGFEEGWGLSADQLADVARQIDA